MFVGGILAAIALGIAAIGGAFLSAATGLGGGVVFFLVTLQFFPLSATIPIHGFVQMWANLFRIYLLRKHLVWGMCVPFFAGAILGVVGVYQLLDRLSNPLIAQILILAIVLYSVFKPSKLPEIKIPLWGFGVLGFATGFLGIIIGAVDPILAPFFIREDLKKEVVVANKSFMQATIHLAKLPVFLRLGFDYEPYAPLLILLVLGSAAGTVVGVRVLDRLNRRVFLLAFKTLLLLVALRMAYTIIRTQLGV